MSMENWTRSSSSKACLRPHSAAGPTTSISFANVFSTLDLKHSFVVVDEAHHIHTSSGNDVQAKTHKAMQLAKRVLLLTGTPSDYLIDNVHNIFTYLLGDAIEHKYVCNYEIYMPRLCHATTKLPIELHDSMLDDDKNALLAQALFLINGMLLHGSRYCVAYLSSIDECSQFQDAMQCIQVRLDVQ